MSQRTALDRQIGVRLPADLVDKLQAAQHRLGSKSLADAARDLLSTALDSDAVRPPEREVRTRTPEDSVKTFEVLVDLLNDLLEIIGDDYPVAAIVMAHNAGVGFSEWAKIEAERHDMTVEQAVNAR